MIVLTGPVLECNSSFGIPKYDLKYQQQLYLLNHCLLVELSGRLVINLYYTFYSNAELFNYLRKSRTCFYLHLFNYLGDTTLLLNKYSHLMALVNF